MVYGDEPASGRSRSRTGHRRRSGNRPRRGERFPAEPVINDLAAPLDAFPEALYRIGRLPNPLLLAPVSVQSWLNRFDDPRRQRRTLYAANHRLTCLYERLAPFRPSLELIALLDRLHASDDASDQGEKLNFQTVRDEIGMVDADFFVKNAFIEFLPMDGQRWLNLQDPYVIEELRRRLAVWLNDSGLDEFDFSDLVARERKVTQHIASLAIESGIQGVIYLSRMHPGERCWALFEGTALRAEAMMLPLTPSDPDCKRVQQVFGLRLPLGLRPSDLFSPRHILTGGIVRGDD